VSRRARKIPAKYLGSNSLLVPGSDSHKGAGIYSLFFIIQCQSNIFS
jgi:hypothetical protein